MKTFYALHHVNRITGEAVRYPRHSFPAGERSAVESDAQGSRCAQAVTSRGDKDGAWETRAMQDVRAELEQEGVPERIIAIVERMAHGRNWGLCDPMYMANCAADSFGWGDGRSHFTNPSDMPDGNAVREFAERIFRSYHTSFGELGLSADGVHERILLGLAASKPEPVTHLRERGG